MSKLNAALGCLVMAGTLAATVSMGAAHADPMEFILPNGTINGAAMMIRSIDAPTVYAQCYQRLQVPKCTKGSDKFTVVGCVEQIYDPKNPEVLVSETTYANGKKDGYELTYYEGGSLYKVMPYRNHQADGMSYEFNRSGRLVETTQYFEGMRHGDARGYYESGNVKFKASYSLDLLHGLYQTYYDALDQVQSNVFYEKGKRSGPGMFYDEQGKQIYEVTFKDDKAVSGKCTSGRKLTNEELARILTQPPKCR